MYACIVGLGLRMTFYHFPCHTVYTLALSHVRSHLTHYELSNIICDCLITEKMQHKGFKQVLSPCSHWCYLPFLSRDAVRKLDICSRPVSVCPSVTLVNCIQTAEDNRQISLPAWYIWKLVMVPRWSRNRAVLRCIDERLKTGYVSVSRNSFYCLALCQFPLKSVSVPRFLFYLVYFREHL